MPDEKLHRGKISFGGSIVDRQGTRVCGDGRVCATLVQQPVYHVRVAKAGSQMQDCGTRIIFFLWKRAS